jgi:hypothetical protein
MLPNGSSSNRIHGSMAMARAKATRGNRIGQAGGHILLKSKAFKPYKIHRVTNFFRGPPCCPERDRRIQMETFSVGIWPLSFFGRFEDFGRDTGSANNGVKANGRGILSLRSLRIVTSTTSAKV